MPLSKRKGSSFWWYDFTVNDHRFRGSTQTNDLALAKSIEAKLRTDAVMAVHFKRREEISLDAAMGKFWLEHAQHLKSGRTAIKSHCRHILDHFGGTLPLSSIDGVGVSELRSVLRERVSDSTVNRVFATLRKLLNKAGEEWEYAVPDIKVGKYMLEEPESRTRWLRRDEADRLISCAADHLKDPIRFALLTGVRLSNIVGLCWEHIRFDENEIEFKVKSSLPGGKLLVLPMSGELRQLLLTCGPREDGYVFLRNFNSPDRPPEPIKKFRRSFKTACERAGIKDFRFHDLRHTAATWMVQNGVALDLVQEILGHSDIATTKKYAHRDTIDKRHALEKLATSQIRHSGSTRKARQSAKRLNLVAHPERLERPTLRFVDQWVDPGEQDGSGI